MATKTNDMQVIAAPLGYYCLSYCIDDEPGGSGEYEVSKSPILGWKIDQSDTDETWAFPITLDPFNANSTTLRPDGMVESCDTTYTSVEAWIEDVKRMAAGRKRYEAARKERLAAEGKAK